MICNFKNRFVWRFKIFYRSSIEFNQGFTLIELMVAISIVAILSTIGMVMFSSAQGTARDAKRKGDLEDIKKAVYLVQTANGGWCKLYGCTWNSPASDGTYGMNGSAANSMKAAFITSGYLKAVVNDPKCPAGTCASWSDYYLSVTNDSVFAIYARLENAPPAGSLIGCTPPAPYNYCTSQ